MSGERDSKRRFLTPPTLPTTFVCRELSIPNSPEWLALVDGALVEMVNAWDWDEFGAVTPEEAAEAALIMFGKYLESGCALIGEILAFATASLPETVLLCDGAIYLKADYPLLYAALGSPFIVDATHFKVPDMRGFTMIGAGTAAGGGGTYNFGSGYGVFQKTLDETEMPQHSHSNEHYHDFMPLVTGDLDVEGVGIPQPNAAQIVPLFNNQTAYNYEYTGLTGGDQPFSVMQPSLAVKYAIRAK